MLDLAQNVLNLNLTVDNLREAFVNTFCDNGLATEATTNCIVSLESRIAQLEAKESALEELLRAIREQLKELGVPDIDDLI